MQNQLSKIIIILFIFILGFGVWFSYKNLRGIAPAFAPPSEDIVKTLEPATNETGIPLKLPDGFSISVFAKNVDNARVLVFDPKGVLLVSAPSQGKVFALPDSNNDGDSDGAKLVVDGLSLPHGLAFHDGKLYVAETDGISVFDYDSSLYRATSKKKIIDLPSGGNHFSRTIGFGPDNKLYVAIGSTCNVCIEKDWRRTKVLVANPDGSGLKEFASGLRNSVFFVWHPLTRDLWATEMGRDLIGDNIPPDEVNILKNGKFYGWPYCYGKKIHDTTFELSQKSKDLCNRSESAHIDLQAHSAPLGLTFIPDNWPAEYKGDLLVSYHGSWNRSTPTGYKIVRMKLDDVGNYESTEDFITGWLGEATKAAGALGRPVDLLFDSKGDLFVSDDKAGVVYKISVQ